MQFLLLQRRYAVNFQETPIDVSVYKGTLRGMFYGVPYPMNASNAVIETASGQITKQEAEELITETLRKQMPLTAIANGTIDLQGERMLHISRMRI